jgi:hypothetical protein
VVAACVVATIAAAGAVAYAEWGGSAAGTGRARATTVVQATLTAVDGAPDLFPGFTDGDVFFTVTNPNPFGITYTDMTATTVTSFLTLAVPTGAAASPAGAQGAVPQGDFLITGELGGLYPGQHTVLEAQVTNLQAFSIRVISVEVTVDDAGPGCAASWLHFEPLTEPVDVAAGTTGTVPVPVDLDFAAPEACRNATWPLTFSATAVESPGAVVPPSTTSTTPASSTTTSEPVGGGHDPEQATPPAGSGSSIPEQLARTGVDLAPVLAAGALLVAAGLVVRRIAARRRMS